MRLAYIITAHKNPEQLARLVARLDAEGASFFVHIDKRTDSQVYGRIVESLRQRPNVHFLTKRFPCNYMTLFGAVQAAVQAIDEIFRQKISFDYLIYLSGQDYPIKTNAQIQMTLNEANGFSFLSYLPLPFEGMHPTAGRVIQNMTRIECWHLHLFGRYVRVPFRGGSLPTRVVNAFLPAKRRFPSGFKPYGGWAYWCLSRRHVQYVHDFVRSAPAFLRFFRYVKSADEIFLQTLLLNSPYRTELINNDLRYVDWSTEDCHPKILAEEDFPKLRESSNLFARKFDLSTKPKVLEMIDTQILKIHPPQVGIATISPSRANSVSYGV